MYSIQPQLTNKSESLVHALMLSGSTLRNRLHDDEKVRFIHNKDTDTIEYKTLGLWERMYYRFNSNNRMMKVNEVLAEVRKITAGDLNKLTEDGVKMAIKGILALNRSSCIPAHDDKPQLIMEEKLNSLKNKRKVTHEKYDITSLTNNLLKEHKSFYQLSKAYCNIAKFQNKYKDSSLEAHKNECIQRVLSKLEELRPSLPQKRQELKDELSRRLSFYKTNYLDTYNGYQHKDAIKHLSECYRSSYDEMLFSEPSKAEFDEIKELCKQAEGMIKQIQEKYKDYRPATRLGKFANSMGYQLGCGE